MHLYRESWSDPENPFSRQIQKLLVRLIAFVFFTLIIMLAGINRFIEHGRILVIMIVMFPFVLMFIGLIIGLTIHSYKSRY
jgi:hypothetical protein